MARERSIVSISSVLVRRSISPMAFGPYRSACLIHSPSIPSVLPPPRAPPKNTSKTEHSRRAICAGCRGLTKRRAGLLHALRRRRRQCVFHLPFLVAELWWNLNHVAARGSGAQVSVSQVGNDLA